MRFIDWAVLNFGIALLIGVVCTDFRLAIPNTAVGMLFLTMSILWEG